MKENTPDEQVLCLFCGVFIILEVMTPYSFKKCTHL